LALTIDGPGGHAVQEVVVGEGIEGLAAELALRSLDGSVHQIFSNREVQQWSFGADGRVVPRGTGRTT